MSKFTTLTETRIPEIARADIAGAIGDLDHVSVAELTRLLRNLATPAPRVVLQRA
jgi:hypothetical protein